MHVFVANDEVEIGEGKTVSRKAVFHVETPRSLGDENELSIDCTEETMTGNDDVLGSQQEDIAIAPKNYVVHWEVIKTKAFF